MLLDIARVQSTAGMTTSQVCKHQQPAWHVQVVMQMADEVNTPFSEPGLFAILSECRAADPHSTDTETSLHLMSA